MATVAAGLRAQGTPATRRRVTKGISQNRSDYDRRRRLTATDADTARYKAQLRHDPCMTCGGFSKTGDVQDVDHIVPLKSGGEDRWTNMAAACSSCNRGRRDTPLLLYMLRRATR